MPAKKQNVLSKSAAAKAVDETLKRSVLTTTSHSETTEYYTGPLPHPDALKKYDEFMPGLAERIVRMAEKEQAYRIDTTNREEDQKDKLLKIAEKESNHLIRNSNLLCVYRGRLGNCYRLFSRSNSLVNSCFYSEKRK